MTSKVPSIRPFFYTLPRGRPKESGIVADPDLVADHDVGHAGFPVPRVGFVLVRQNGQDEVARLALATAD